MDIKIEWKKLYLTFANMIDLIKPAWPCASSSHTWGWLMPPHKVSATEAAHQGWLPWQE